MGGVAAGERDGMAPEQSVLHLAGDGILCVNRDHVIEFMNPAVTQMLGHSPEQKLGCPVTTILTNASATLLDSKVSAGEPIDEKIFCVTETHGEVYCRCVAFWPNHDKGGERCILILSDIAAVEARRGIAKEAQDVVHRLWTEVMPPEIEAREHPFAVPVATVIVLSLGQIPLEHSSPQEIMSRLTALFTAFENCAHEFSGITKVRIFGETMVCVAGLFAEVKGDGAEEAIYFAQGCVDVLEDLNVKNYAEFTIQIGIHTGGPIICGVVERRARFDVIGGPIKLARLLQRTAPQNTIQVSEATHAKLSGAAYSMAKRTVKEAGKEFATYLLRSVGSSGSSV
jgi:hypothetical protein